MSKASEASKQSRTKRLTALANNLEALKKELIALKASDKVMKLFNAIEASTPKLGSGTSDANTSYLERIFGTNEPAPNMTVSLLYAGVRGPQDERLNKDETLAKFVARVGDANFIADAKTIKQWAFNMKDKHVVKVDTVKGSVTYVAKVNAEVTE